MNRKIRRIHFVGIGGIGMAGLAELLHNQGYRISGSDVREGATVTRLKSLGVDVSIGHDAVHVGDCDVAVTSTAIRPGNPEVERARARGIPVIARAEMLAEVMRLKDGIAVAGSHGKTTTTSLIAHVLDAVGLDPTAVIGGRVRAPGSDPTGARLGRGDLLVAEADESDGSFLRLHPVIAVVTNIDPEHLDHYGSFEAVQDAFVEFTNGLPFWGAAVVCVDHPGIQAILPRLTRPVVRYGFSAQADWVADAVEVDGFGMRFRVRAHGVDQGPVHVPLPGVHNVANALATLAVAAEFDVDFSQAADALAAFPGVERRFQALGEAAGVQVVDDYAHHPAELRATLASARAAHRGRVVAIFQPHRYSRTHDLFEDFATAFHDVDHLVVTEVYAAGEAKIPGAEGAPLVEAIRAHGHRSVQFEPEIDRIAQTLPGDLRAGDLVLTLGAGDISRLGPLLLDRLAARGTS